MEYRIEHDSMGEVQVPADRYWGAQTQRSFQNFPIGTEKIPMEVIRAFAILKKAAAIANNRLGKLDDKRLALISQACDEILAGKLDDNFPLAVWQTGSGTQSNMNVNEVIAGRGNAIAGEKLLHPNDHSNMSQSSNDTFPTAMHIAAVMEIEDKLFPAIDRLTDTFTRLMAENEGIVKTGRTHLQDATPISFSQEISGWREMLIKSKAMLTLSLKGLHELALGGTAVGTGLNAEVEYIKKFPPILSDLVGFQFESAPDLIDTTNSTDCFAEVSSALKVSALSLIKIANDMRLMASGPRCGLNEIKLPPRQPGSSIMPGKVNPVIAELLDQTCYHVIGNDLAVTMAVENGQLELNVMEPVLAFNLFNSFRYLTNAINTFTNLLLKDLKANKEQCQKWVDNSVGIITALLPHLGYEKCSAIAKEAYNQGTPVKEIIMREKLMTRERMEEILSPFEMTHPGIAGGKK